MAIARQFLLTLENKPGTLADVCSQLAAKAVNLQAISIQEGTGFSTIRMVVSHPDAARKVCQNLGVQFVEEDVLLVRVPNRPGALGRITRKLADNKVNIQYVYGSMYSGASKAALALGVSNLKKASKLVK
jgi:hypothetical protein